MAARLKDIARDLNLSIVTVSKVLRDHPDISTETRDRVRQRMKELNYRPNLAARALVTGRTHAIGLVVPDLVHPFYGQVAKALSTVLRGRGYSLVLASSEDDPELEQQEIEQLLTRRVDVLVVASTQRSVETFRAIEEQKTPYVLIDRRFDGFRSNFVGVNDVEVGRIATEHLIDVGCRRIAHIGGPEVSTALGRLRGYRDVLAAKGIRQREDYIVLREHGDDAGDQAGYSAMKRLLEIKPRPDGVFCFNDPTAVGAMKAVLETGLNLPNDVAIVGCGNVAYADFLRVPLTSVDQQSGQIGERAGKLALSLLLQRPTRPRQILLEPKLVERASTRRKGTRKR
ncbi:MAG TPA: LacI family DNA-binding transcriptional regulator [Bryobacteraceae bacterium]|nr:LacI family DNA-binding transcriptional regulator [Bryobacteraceae bacterium]